MNDNKRNTQAYQTFDINLSPLKKRKGKPMAQKKNKRQIIITGSSPYL